MLTEKAVSSQTHQVETVLRSLFPFDIDLRILRKKVDKVHRSDTETCGDSKTTRSSPMQPGNPVAENAQESNMTSVLLIWNDARIEDSGERRLHCIFPEDFSQSFESTPSMPSHDVR